MFEAFLPPDLRWIRAALALLAVGLTAAFVAEIGARIARTLMLRLSGADTGTDFRSPIVRRPIRVTRATVFAAVLLLLIGPVFETAGMLLPFGLRLSMLSAWLIGPGLRILVIAALAYGVVQVISVVSRRLEETVNREGAHAGAQEQVKRARTLSRLVKNALTIIATGLAFLMILRELNVDVMPILTGAGIVGLAVGFGAQTLVKDLISGFFLILENQVRVGDVARINGTGGLVEAIGLRTVALRDLSGTVHIFPNGSIDTLANLTKDFSYAVLDVGVAYKENVDEVMALLTEVGAALAGDPRYALKVMEPLEVLGVDGFEASQVTIKIRIKTQPLQQWEVARELRRRIKSAFDARGIEIPFPHLSVYFGEASHPFATRQVN